MLVVLIASENMLKSLTPYLKPTAAIKVSGWTSRLLGWSLKLNDSYQASILSKLIEETCSYFIALIFLSADKTMISFFVGSAQIYNIFLVRSIELRTLWTGDRKVSTKVSYNNKLNTTGNIFPAGRAWLARFCLMIFPSTFYFKNWDSIGTLKSYLSFSFTCTTIQIDIVSTAKFILTILCKKGHEKRIV